MTLGKSHLLYTELKIKSALRWATPLLFLWPYLSAAAASSQVHNLQTSKLSFLFLCPNDLFCYQNVSAPILVALSFLQRRHKWPLVKKRLQDQPSRREDRKCYLLATSTLHWEATTSPGSLSRVWKTSLWFFFFKVISFQLIVVLAALHVLGKWSATEPHQVLKFKLINNILHIYGIPHGDVSKHIHIVNV